MESNKSVSIRENQSLNNMKRLSGLGVCLLMVLTACSQQPNPSGDHYLIGGPCEGCEAVLEFGDRTLHAVDTMPGFDGEDLPLKIYGTVYQPDGTTPASNVILYFYQTDQEGIYTPAKGAAGWARKHGAIREWLKTGPDGQYTLYTRKPGAYPSGTEPPHIHLTVLEPDGAYYWLPSYLFAGDPLRSEVDQDTSNPRGGYARVLELEQTGNLWTGKRDIILRANLED
jgi:protocatechuate 3,4-dioxygenase, beta subunit